MDKKTLAEAVRWEREGSAAALAIVAQTWGSAPRPAGSLLAVREDGQFSGSVSGGCIEGDVITKAQEIIKTGKADLVEYGVSNNKAWEVGLACGGKISIYTLPVAKNLSVLKKILDQPASVLEINIQTENLKLTSDKTKRAELNAPHLRLPFLPPLRLVIIGAVHIAAALINMAKIADYEITLIDPRPSFIDSQDFASLDDIKIINDWPDKILPAMNLCARDAVVVLSHDPKIDDPALITAVQSDAFYVGALGSQKTHAARIARLKDHPNINRIHAPIGLNIGAQGAAEIALAILAQMTEDLRK